MKAPALRFNSDDLRDLAGDTTFERGLGYLRKGAVRITRLEARPRSSRSSSRPPRRNPTLHRRLELAAAAADPSLAVPALEKALKVATRRRRLLRLLIEERRYDRAWTIAAQNPVGDGALEALAAFVAELRPATPAAVASSPCLTRRPARPTC